MNKEFDHELEEELDKKYVKCRTCGGYGYWFNTEAGNAAKCPTCLGDKISRHPHDYKDKKDIPPPPK